MRYKEGTLCWECANAVPTSETGCSWSLDKTPVEGWSAIDDTERYKRYQTSKEIQRYWFVVACPEFMKG